MFVGEQGAVRHEAEQPVSLVLDRDMVDPVPVHESRHQVDRLVLTDGDGVEDDLGGGDDIRVVVECDENKESGRG